MKDGWIINTYGPECLERYQQVSIAFEVQAVWQVEPVDGGAGGLRIVEEALAVPWQKDYDADERPRAWVDQFDMTHWRFFLAEQDGQVSGAAALVWDFPQVNMLDRRADLLVLWDIRVNPARRGQGLGRALFQQAEAWGRAHGCRQMKIETQNINVNACRFYRAMGCELGGIQRYAYAANPHVAREVMLLWYKDL